MSAAMSDDFTVLPDLASRALGGSVVYADDELFAERENLITPAPPTYSAHTFGHKGQVYDGWETRRRREPGHDTAIVRLGVPGVVRGVVVDTSFFTGNYPPHASVEACAVEGYPSPTELLAAEWETVLSTVELAGDTRNVFGVDCPRRFTHVRLSIYPDGGVARFRVHGDVVADPRPTDAGPLDLAALENGADAEDCSNRFYSSPSSLLLPGLARVMGDGWETARRRGDGNDWVMVRLAGQGVVTLAELDTSYFVGNAPGWASVRGRDASGAGPAGSADGDGWWFDLVPMTRLQPDTRHRFRVDTDRPVTHARLDIYPDGGMARLRLFGRFTPDGRAGLGVRWFDALPDAHARAVLTAECGAGGAGWDAGDALLAGRPYRHGDGLRAALSGMDAEVAGRIGRLVLGPPGDG